MSLLLPRVNAHRMMVIAAGITTLMAALLASALTVLSAGALPLAAHEELTTAGSGTALAVTGTMNARAQAQYAALLPGQIRSALDGTPVTLYQGRWSDPLGLVGSGSPRSDRQNAPIVVAAALDQVNAHAVLVAGTWPWASPARIQHSTALIPAALPETAAALLHLSVGDTLRLRDRVSGTSTSFSITGLYRPAQPGAAYWELDTVGLSGSSTVGGFTTYGPLTVADSAFSETGAITGTGTLNVNAASWVAEPDTAAMAQSSFSDIAAKVSNLRQALYTGTSLPSLLLTTSLPDALTGIASKLDVARSLLAICDVLLALLAASALLAVARLLAGHREGETAMLAARGAARGQLIRIAAAEAVPLCAFSAVVGAAAGIWLARLLAPTAPTRLSAAVVQTAATVACGALVVMLAPTLSGLTPGAARARRGRQAALSAISRAGTDLALIVLAVLACWQLRHYSAVSVGVNGDFGVDPVVVAAPALALAAGTVTALRLLPLGGKVGDRFAAHGRRLGIALASWQISRQPIRQGGAALLIVLAVASATLAFAQRQSWVRSGNDQAAFSVGADVRVQTQQPLTAAQAGSLVRLRGVRHAMPATDFIYAVGNSDALAVDASQAASVTLLRADQARQPEATLFRKIRTAPVGVTLPGQPRDLTVVASLGPASLGLSPALVTIIVEDSDDDAYQLPPFSLPDDGITHKFTLPLANGPAVYPVRIAAIDATYTLPTRLPGALATFTIDSIAGMPGAQLRSFTASASSPQLTDALANAGVVGGYQQPVAAQLPGQPSAARSVTFGTGYGQAEGNPGQPPYAVQGQLTLTAAVPAVIGGIATQSFLAANNTQVGSTVAATINGVQTGIRIVAAVPGFPTMSPAGTVVVDLGAVQNLLIIQSQTQAPVLQWWLATAGGQVPAGLVAGLPAGSSIMSRTAIGHALLNDPLSGVPQQALLSVAVAALVLASTGFCVSIAAGVRQRRGESALLAALGVTPRAAAAQLCLEKFLLSLPSALAGLALGTVLADLLVPAITLSATAATPVPPVLIEFGWVPALGTALLLAVLPVVVAALATTRRPDPAAALRASETA